MRLRQVALVAADLEAPKADLSETLGIEVTYRDRATAEARAPACPGNSGARLTLSEGRTHNTLPMAVPFG